MIDIAKKEQLIVALDFANFDEAKLMVELLGDEVSFYKIGLEMMMSGDFFKMAHFLKENDKKIFADLKLYDISETVARSVKALSKIDVDLLTIHCANSEIMKRAAQEKGNMKLLGVSVLTCLDKSDLNEMGFDKNLSLEELVLKKAELAVKCGIDGVVSSALEAKMLRKNLGDNFLITTPAIRLEKSNDDQKRVASVSEALKNGANYLVVGRPITRSEDPKQSAQKFNQEIAQS